MWIRPYLCDRFGHGDPIEFEPSILIPSKGHRQTEVPHCG